MVRANEVEPAVEKRWAWTKLSSERWRDVWEERLQYVGSQRLVISRLGDSSRIKLEVYNLTAAEGALLCEIFGGGLRSQARWREETFVEGPAPVHVGGRLTVVSSPEAEEGVRRQFPSRKTLVIPATAAFGTGEHATTGMCLRVLSNLARAGFSDSTRILDLGTGTGVLALAATAFGAGDVEGLDNDPMAVQVARANGIANGLQRVKFQTADVLKWRVSKRYDVVMANLYAGILTRIAGKLRRAVKKDGRLVVSGVMKNQQAECEEALRSAGFDLPVVRRKGKWVMLVGVPGDS